MNLLKSLKLPADESLKNIALGAAVFGLAFILLAISMGIFNPKPFFASYLVSFMFFLSLVLGCTFFVLIQFITRSGWSVVVRRLAEYVMAIIPIFFVLIIPILLGVGHLFHWTHGDVVAHDVLLKGKVPYLNIPFFLTRAAIYLIVWTFISRWYFKTSVEQDKSGDHELTRKMQWWSGPSLMLMAMTISFAAIDWMMSLDPHWFSTIFGVYYFSGSFMACFAVLILFAKLLQRSGYLLKIVSPEHFHDLGKLLFGFMVFWTYIAFSQYFLIWYANIPEETIWYMHRMEGSWDLVTKLLAFGHFVVPFFFLMPRTIKRHPVGLIVGAIWLMAVHFMDLYWLIMPVFYPHGIHVSLFDVATFLGLGGLFVASVAWVMRKSAIVPVKDPRLSESLRFENM